MKCLTPTRGDYQGFSNEAPTDFVRRTGLALDRELVSGVQDTI